MLLQQWRQDLIMPWIKGKATSCMLSPGDLFQTTQKILSSLSLIDINASWAQLLLGKPEVFGVTPTRDPQRRARLVEIIFRLLGGWGGVQLRRSVTSFTERCHGNQRVQLRRYVVVDTSIAPQFWQLNAFVVPSLLCPCNLSCAKKSQFATFWGLDKNVHL